MIGKATAVDLSTTDYVRCQVYDRTDKVVLDGATTQVGAAGILGGPLTNLATVEVASGAAVLAQQRCGHGGQLGLPRSGCAPRRLPDPGRIAVGGAATADFARCELTTTAGHLDGAATWEPHNGDASVTVLGTVKLSSTSTFSETCSRDTAGQTTSNSGSLVLIRI